MNPSDRAPLPQRLDDLEQAARPHLPAGTFDYYAGGAEDEVTLRANRSAWQQIFLRPRVLNDVSSVDLGVDLFGDRIALPVLLAPTAFQRLADPEHGESASARAARRAGTLLVASTLATTSVEDIAAAAPGPFWFQVYLFRDRGLTDELVQRARQAGARALCLTVTVPVQGRRERDARNAFRLPPDLALANFTGRPQSHMQDPARGSGLEDFIHREFDPSLTWSDLERLAASSGLPVLVKGVVTFDDARIALDHGAAGIIVSNHGGRQLDGAEPTAVALPHVVDGVEGRVPVLVDGGIRRGSDIVKALALGATATLIGRPYLWALALQGEDGVVSVLEHLRTETARTLALVGCTRARDVPQELISPWRPGGRAGR
jgi:isopentenyl diphosphate isomerase/L-lactate dehydrogenase-like FMN-dependent dehydrogenase